MNVYELSIEVIIFALRDTTEYVKLVEEKQPVPGVRLVVGSRRRADA